MPPLNIVGRGKNNRVKGLFVAKEIKKVKQKIIIIRYLTMGGGVRIGRILEDMDIFAVHLVFKHVENPRQVDHHQHCSSLRMIIRVLT